MNIVRRYTCETQRGVVRYYVQVEAEGAHMELGSDVSLSDAAWLTLAEQVIAASAPPEPTVGVEAEDGVIV